MQLEKARAKYASSTEGARAIREQVTLQRQLNAAQKDASWREMVVEQGKFGAGLSFVNEQLVRFQSVATYAFAGGIAGITGLVAGSIADRHGDVAIRN